MTVRVSFGQWLKQHRKTLDLTQEDLAARIGCATITLYKIESDKRRPSKQMAELLAEHLHIPSHDYQAFIRFARAEAVESDAPFGTPFHPPTNLPAPPTPLIGRSADVTAICKRLSHADTRLLTLTGPPGIGKTRLALQVATALLDDFPAGVFFVALAPVTDPTLVPMTMTSILGLPDVGPQTPLERLKAFLRDKQILLILDNFEQLLAAAPHIADLLAVCPLLKLLVTSRAPLRIRHERQFPVSPLAIPDLDHLPDVESVQHYAAVTLFMERAQAVKPEFSLTPDNAPTIAAICTRLDGLPLAIELISARIKLLPPASLLERLHGRLMLQSDGLRDLEPRHRTLNAAIDWSYQLLTAEEQMLFRRLGVFVGGWTLDAASAVCMDNLPLNLIDSLASLLDKNLVKQAATSDGTPRFMLLETIREYALEQAAVSHERDNLCQRHTDYFFKLAEAAEARVYGREQIGCFDQLEVEWDNLRAALIWSQNSETGLRLVAALGWFFSQRSHWNEGLDWLDRLLATNPNASASLRAKALNSAGALAALLGDGQRMQVLFEEALTLARATNDRWNIAWSLHYLGTYSGSDPDPAPSSAALEESLALFRALEDPLGISHALFRRAYRALDQKDYAYVRLLLSELAIRAREAEDTYITAWVVYLLGRATWSQDRDLGRAKRYFEQSLSLFREAKYQDGVNMALISVAEIEQALGNVERTQLLYEEALILHRQSALNHPRIPFILAGLANVAKVRGQFERAARLLGAANNSWLEQFANFHPEIVPLESDTAAIRAHLGEAAFAGAWAEGQAMTMEQVVAYALDS